MKRFIVRRVGRRRGSAIVELAIVLPVLLLILLGIIEYGHAYLVTHNMITATAQGARFGINPGRTEEQVVDFVRDVLNDTGIGGYDMAIETVLTPEPTVSCRVTVSVPFSEVAIFSGFVSDGILSKTSFSSR